jgi:hypothetical protein
VPEGERASSPLWQHGGVLARLGRPRRWIGALLVAYGLLGLVACVLVASTGLSFADATRAAAHDLDAERMSAVSTIAASELVVGQVADGVTSSQEGLASASALLARASSLTASLASTSRDLAGTLDVEILGQKPFAGVTASVLGISTSADEVAADLGSVSTSLGAISGQAPGIGSGLRSLAGQLADARIRLGRLGEDDRFAGASGSLGIAIAVLLGWLAVQAAVCTLLGLALAVGRSGTPGREAAGS